MRPRQKSRAVDDIGQAVLDWLNQSTVLGRIVFEIGVLNDDDVASRSSNSSTESSSLALIDLVIQHSDGWNFARSIELTQNLARSVLGAVVNNDDLFIEWSFLDAFEYPQDGAFLVVDRYDD